MELSLFSSCRSRSLATSPRPPAISRTPHALDMLCNRQMTISNDIARPHPREIARDRPKIDPSHPNSTQIPPPMTTSLELPLEINHLPRLPSTPLDRDMSRYNHNHRDYDLPPLPPPSPSPSPTPHQSPLFTTTITNDNLTRAPARD